MFLSRALPLLLLSTSLYAESEPIPQYIARPASATFTEAQVYPAALQGNVALVQEALKNGFNVNHLDANKRTPLMMAAFNGHATVCKALLTAGANVNLQDQTGTSALMFAASGPSKDTIKLLLDSGAKINMIDRNEHFSALMWAAAEGKTDNCRFLLEKGADPLLQDTDGDTAASFAAKAGHQQAADLINAFIAKNKKDIKPAAKTPPADKEK